jgi:hypothetical protein
VSVPVTMVPVTIMPMGVVTMPVTMATMTMPVAVTTMTMPVAVTMAVTTMAVSVTMAVTGKCCRREHHRPGNGSREANFAKHWFPPKELQELCAVLMDRAPDRREAEHSTLARPGSAIAT